MAELQNFTAGRGWIVHIEGIPVGLVGPTNVLCSRGNWNLIVKLRKERKASQAAKVRAAVAEDAGPGGLFRWDIKGPGVSSSLPEPRDLTPAAQDRAIGRMQFEIRCRMPLKAPLSQRLRAAWLALKG